MFEALKEFWNVEVVPNKSGHFIHRDDEDEIDRWISTPGRVAIPRDPEDYRPRSCKLHLGLRPIPYVGDLSRADIFIAMTKPNSGGRGLRGQ